MVAILHSEILVLAILDSAILVFTSKTTHTCQDWFPPFAKKLHSFIQTQLDDGRHLKICHVGFRHCYLGFRHLVIFSQIHSKHSHSTLTLTQTNSIWLTWRWQPYRILPSWIWPSWIQPFCTKKLDSFTLIELDDGSHLEFCHVGFRHCYLEFRYLVIFSQTYSKTLSVYCDFDSSYSNLTETHSFWLNLMMAALLTLAILDSVILVFSLKLIHICQDWFPLFAWKKFPHSFWPNLMMAAILNSVILKSTILDSANLHKKKPWLIHSNWTWWWQLSWIFHLGFSHFAQNKLHSFILTQLDDGSHL